MHLEYFRQERIRERESDSGIIDFDCDWIVFDRSIWRDWELDEMTVEFESESKELTCNF